MQLFVQESRAAFQDTDGAGQRRQKQKQKERQTEQSAARHHRKDLRQRHKRKTAAHAQPFGAHRDKHDRDDRQRRQNRDQRIENADHHRAAQQIFFLRHIRAIRHHDAHPD